MLANLTPCPRSRTSSTCSTAGTRPHTADELGRRRAGGRRPGAATSRKVMFAVDPTAEVAAEAADWGADLLVVHHPLFLKPVHGVRGDDAEGPHPARRWSTAGCALLTAHTNADQAAGGVSEALATALGLADLAPLVPAPGRADGQADRLRAGRRGGRWLSGRRVAEAGAGTIGDYDFASFSLAAAQGRFRPLAGARARRSATVGEIEVVDEVRVEVVLPARRAQPGGRRAAGGAPLRGAGVRRRRARRPAQVADSADRPDRHASRRTTLGEFAEAVAAGAARTAHGVRVAGDPTRSVRRVAVCGGAGDFLLDTIAAHRRRRVRHQRPAAPPGGGVRRAGRPGAGRRRPLGGRVDLAAGGGRRGCATRWGTPCRPGSASSSRTRGQCGVHLSTLRLPPPPRSSAEQRRGR